MGRGSSGRNQVDNFYARTQKPKTPPMNTVGELITMSVYSSLQNMLIDLAPAFEALAGVDWEHIRLEKYLPANWRGMTDNADKFENAVTLIGIKEGLPLGWVPGRTTLDMIIDADSAEDRISILKQRRMLLIDECIAEVKSIPQPDLKEYKKFALSSFKAYKKGCWKESQAASTNIIDTILRRRISGFSKLINKKGAGARRYELDIRGGEGILATLVMSGVYGAYDEFGNNDTIPSKYSRHASAHAVSKAQYSKVNSVIAAMHLTSLLKLLSEVDQSHIDNAAAWLRDPNSVETDAIPA